MERSNKTLAQLIAEIEAGAKKLQEEVDRPLMDYLGKEPTIRELSFSYLFGRPVRINHENRN